MYPWEILTTHLRFFYKTDFIFDADRLLKEYKEVERRFKFSTEYPIPPTGWELLAIRSYLSDPLHVRSLPNYTTGRLKDKGEDFEWTEVAKYTPYLRSAIEEIGCKTYRIRFARIVPFGFIHLHSDTSHCWNGHIVRLFVPIVSADKAQQKICHEESGIWSPGEVWYGEYSFPHRAWNMNRDITRVGMIIDFDADSMRDNYPNLLPEDYHDLSGERSKIFDKVITLYNEFKGTIKYA